MNAPGIACGHPMCRPGSPECRARDTEPAMAAVEQAASERSAVVQRLMGEAVDRASEELAALVLADARQQLDNARGNGALFGPRHGGAEAAEEIWRRNNPGLSRLLDLDN